MMCSHCHGINGDGKGSVDHPVYSLIPSYSDSIQIRRTGGNDERFKGGSFVSFYYIWFKCYGTTFLFT